MYYVKLRGFTSLLILLILLIMVTAFLLLTFKIFGQQVKSRLDQQVDVFVSDATSGDEQLIELAQLLKIPIGIEWVDDGSEKNLQPVHLRKTTVREAIRHILQQHPGHEFKEEDGIIHIFSNTFIYDSRNFLNLRIQEFSLTDASLFEANYQLRKSILRTLHTGVNLGGGYGYGASGDDGFDKKNISFSNWNLSVREILTKIAVANGNALWVVRLIPTRMMAKEPFFVQGPSSKEARNTTSFIWQFIPLRKVPVQNKSQ
jgi:flagellar basal body-associated protein FliL